MRPVRILLVANDGLSAGHVARMIAIADALRDARVVLATTSQAHALLGASAAVIVQLPAPAIARSAGFSDAERRRLVSGTIEGLAKSFAPDVVAIDTFPLGPHRELAGIDLGYAKRALVRRHVPESVLEEPRLADGLELQDLVVLADDGGRLSSTASRSVHVPPITIARSARSKADARRALALPAEGCVVLVAAGGGGDDEATAQAMTLAEALVRIDAECTVALALGPLAARRAPEAPRIRAIHAAPLAPYLAAFDGAFAPAGYNTTHELALARVPSVLYAQARPFDDQAARAARVEATVLGSFEDPAIRNAYGAMKPLRAIEPGGAAKAAKALLDLATRQA